MMRRLCLIFLITLSLNPATLTAQDAETHSEKWQCKDIYFPYKVILTAERKNEIGNIHLAGIKHKTAFEIKGFNRVWHFGLKEGFYDYRLLIKPNGRGSYYDFSDSEKEVKPSQLYDCTLNQPKNQ